MDLSLDLLSLPVVASDPRCLHLAATTVTGEMASALVSYAVAHTPWLDLNPEHLPFYLPAELFGRSKIRRLELDSIQLTDELLQYIAASVTAEVSELIVSAAYTTFIVGLPSLLEVTGPKLNKLVLRHIQLHDDAEILGLSRIRSDCLSEIELLLYDRKEELNELTILVENHPQQIRKLTLSIKGVVLMPLDTLFVALAKHANESLIYLSVVNFQVETEALSTFLLSCTNLISLTLKGSFWLEMATMDSLQATAKWRHLDLDFRVTPPVETYQCLNHFPKSILDMGLTFGPCIQSILQQAQIGESFLKIPKLYSLKYNTQLFHQSLVSLILPVHGPTLVSLDIGQCENLTDDGLSLILECSPNLEKLWIHSDTSRMNRKITGQALLGYSCDKLKVLYINYFKSIPHPVLQHVASSSPRLEEIHLAGITAVNDDILELLGRRCSKLWKVDVQKCWNITDRGIELLAEYRNRGLRDLSIAGCFRLTDASLYSLARYCPNLEVLLRHGTIQMSKEAIEHLRSKLIKNLCHFRFEWFC